MFTGLVEEIGTVERLDRHSKGLKLFIRISSSFNDIKIGDSISVDGTCLTIADLDKKTMLFDVTQESLKRTVLQNLKKGDKVNLERAIKAGQRLGGHFVTGHIDYKTRIKNVEIKGDNSRLEVVLPEEYKRFVVSKGSVAVDGVSLTVGEILKDSFTVYLIPHTLENTTLGLKKRGDVVNIEVDLVGKYVVGSKDEEKMPKIDIGFLKEHGFMQL